MVFWNKVCSSLKHTFIVIILFDSLMSHCEHFSHFKDRKLRPREVEGSALCDVTSTLGGWGLHPGVLTPCFISLPSSEVLQG